MKIVFMGTPDYAVPSLKALADSRHSVVGVFTQPDKPRGRGNKVTASPVKEAAEQMGIPVFQPQRIRIDGLDDLIKMKPDLCVTAAFGQILSQSVLDVPAVGTVNVHASLLPKYRGSSPIPWCIMNGEKVTGVTTMLTDAGIDTGDILLTRECPIEPEDTTGTMTKKLAQIGASLLIETIDKLENGTCPRRKQDESMMSYYPKITKETGLLDFANKADHLKDLVRAMDPWPGCAVSIGGEMIKVWSADAVCSSDPSVPGTIISPDDRKGISITTADGLLILRTIQAPGGKRMDSADYLKGHSIKASTVDPK